MKADVVLTGHPELVDVQGRAARRRDDGPDAFVDPGLLQRLVANARHDFEQELAKEKAAAR